MQDASPELSRLISQLNSQMRHLPADFFAHLRVIFTDTGCKDKGVEAAQFRVKRSNVFDNPIDKVVDGKASPLVPGCLCFPKLPHIIADTGNTE